MRVKNPAVLAIILVNVVVFAWMFKFSYYFDKNENYYIENYGFNYSAFSSGEIPKVSLLVCNFIHGNAGHLLSNAIILVLFGIFIEREIGGARLVVLYLVAGFGGTFIQAYYIPTRVFGASAAAFGFIGAFLAFYLSYCRTFSWQALRRISRRDISLLYPHYLFVVALLSLIVLLYRVFTNPDIRIGDVAHYWGFAIGVIISISMRGRRRGQAIS